MNRILIFCCAILVLVFFLHGNNSLKEKDLLANLSDSAYITKEISAILNETNLSPIAFSKAYSGLIKLENENLIKNDSLLTIIDYSKPSYEERFFIIDIKKMQLLNKTLVAHGRNSGEIMAENFSNNIHSFQSSLGLFVASDTYMGRNGYSLRLNGMQKGLNDNARERAIVIHGANYVCQSYIQQNGRIGRSYGCPALPDSIANQIIDLIKGGSCLYIYHPNLSAK